MNSCGEILGALNDDNVHSKFTSEKLVSGIRRLLISLRVLPARFTGTSAAAQLTTKKAVERHVMKRLTSIPKVCLRVAR